MNHRDIIAVNAGCGTFANFIMVQKDFEWLMLCVEQDTGSSVHASRFEYVIISLQFFNLIMC